MYIVLGFYAFIILAVIVLSIVSLLIWDKRYRKNHGSNIPSGFERTEEVTIDPSTDKKLRVYYNSSTGERFYHDEEK